MNVVNKSRKIIGINGEPLLPGASMLLPEGYETHLSIIDYLKKGILADTEDMAIGAPDISISGLEREKIAKEAVEQYKKQQEEAAAKEKAAAQAAKTAEVKAVRAMKKPELLTKAAGMGLVVNDDDTADILKEKIVAALG